MNLIKCINKFSVAPVIIYAANRPPLPVQQPPKLVYRCCNFTSDTGRTTSGSKKYADSEQTMYEKG